MSPLSSTLCYSAFFILFLFVHLTETANLETKHPPKGLLKVRLDYGLATQPVRGEDEEGSHRWVWSSYLEFKDPVSSITDSQIRMMAQNAHKEMEIDMMQYDPEDQDGQFAILPTVMTILAFDNKIILASSQRGRSGFINEWPQSPVKLSLDRCSVFWRERALANPDYSNPYSWHRNKAKCGEVNAFHLYYMTNDQPIPDLNPKMRVTSVRKQGKNYVIVPPCGQNKNGVDSKTEWGCNLLVPDQKVKYINDDVAPAGYGLKKIAGGVQRQGQIQMCTRNRIIWDGE
ncbi:hypothetical protein FPRO06_07231 [Fusarium proliferatum]|uniref:Uncharacterized protein n=1 Tax=Fusarium proliferatum (strain ET1) TaxID=1227346 RepID=A0A1L7VBW4_FUSPR|nr:uncharacterized protein FPRO_06612 [Fusarium proliferatum ET1]KAG4285971.1 hypothetical protein FPRO06_07231 [Fusarium proliferatum]KAI1064056.1 hypothetical protein LB506_005452 [Fusarium annulatum]CZR38197.1 uncharacterized protein FPRO_06612 [Fusarium proliferatum ET1]